MTGTSMVTDIRIVVEGLRDVKKVCDALEMTSLGGDFSASITSIIPTTDPFIAVNAACGADIVIIATDADQPGYQISEQMEDALQGVCPIVDKVRIPSGQNVEYFDTFLLKEAIEKSIVRSGLKALKQMQIEYRDETAFAEDSSSDCEAVEEPIPMDIFSFEEEAMDNDGSAEEDHTVKEVVDEEAIYEANELKIENQRYQSQVSDLEKRLNEIMIDSFEKYDIGDVWESIFPEHVPDLEEVRLAATRLSDDVFVSGNFIFAQSLKKVEEFLKEFRNTFM